MFQNDAAILQHKIEQFKKELPDYISKIEDKIISRMVLPVRKIGAELMWDNVEHYDRTGEGAQILAKGQPPKGSGSVASLVPFQMFQVVDGFKIHEKDLMLDSKVKSRDLEIILGNIHRKENIMAIRGDAPHNIKGLVGAAQANTNGTETATTNWATTASALYYNDLLRTRDKMDADFEPRWLIGNRTDLNKLDVLSDDTKQPVWKQIASLFGKTEMDSKKSWMVPCGDLTLPTGKVYMCAQDPKAAELVISENPTLRALPQQPGGNYPIEMYEWLNVEIHEDNAFVELDVTP